jgi:hypothetical protein
MNKKEQEALVEHFRRTMELVGAGPGSDNYYRGVLDNAPYLVEIGGTENPVYIFKFRTLEEVEEKDTWVDGLGEEFGGLDLLVNIEGGYLFLFVYKALQMEPEMIVRVARRCVADHARLFPAGPGFCYRCRTAGAGGELAQLGHSVSLICPACLETLGSQIQEEGAKLNPFVPRRLVYLPAALTVSALFWYLLWWGFDSALSAGGGDVQLPMKLTCIGALVVGLGVGWPVGKLLQSSGIGKKVPLWLVAGLTCVLTALLGETLYAIHLGVQMGGVPLSALPFLVILMNTGANGFYLMIKASFVIGIAVSIYSLMKPKPVEVVL